MPSLYHLISRFRGLDPEELDHAARRLDNFGVDSFDLIELVVEMESQLDIQVPDRALENVVTVGDIVRIASRALA